MFYVIIEILIKENPTDIKNDEATSSYFVIFQNVVDLKFERR